QPPQRLLGLGAHLRIAVWRRALVPGSDEAVQGLLVGVLHAHGLAGGPEELRDAVAQLAELQAKLDEL
ncbi:MAG TPA: hypothetical protein QGF58_21445, partial [Myxococcota bacterium]|nr:hypothetical protein [Myxococcota bacterium]